MHRGRLPDLDAPAVRLVEARGEVHRRQVRQFHDRRARPRPIALAEVLDASHSPAETPVGIRLAVPADGARSL